MKIASYVSLLLATIIWAFAPALVKLTFSTIDPYFFLFLRFLIVSLFCIPFIIFRFKKEKYSIYDLKNLIIFSITGQVSLIIYFQGLDLTTSTDTIILGLLGPLLTISAGHYFFHEKIGMAKKVGISLALIGAVLVVIEPLLSQSNGTAKDRFAGNLLVLTSSVIGTFWVIYAKFLFGKNSLKFISFMKKFGFKLHKKIYNNIDFNIGSFYIAFICMIPFYLLNLDSYNSQILSLSNISWGVIFYMAIFSSIIANILYIKAQSKLEVSEVSILGYISPIFSLPASFIILNEIPSYTAFLGLLIILFGVFIAEKAKIKLK